MSLDTFGPSRLSADTNTHPDSDTDTHSNTDSHSDSDSDSDPNSDSDTDSRVRPSSAGGMDDPTSRRVRSHSMPTTSPRSDTLPARFRARSPATRTPLQSCASTATAARAGDDRVPMRPPSPRTRRCRASGRPKPAALCGTGCPTSQVRSSCRVRGAATNSPAARAPLRTVTTRRTGSPPSPARSWPPGPEQVGSPPEVAVPVARFRRAWVGRRAPVGRSAAVPHLLHDHSGAPWPPSFRCHRATSARCRWTSTSDRARTAGTPLSGSASESEAAQRYPHRCRSASHVRSHSGRAPSCRQRR